MLSNLNELNDTMLIPKLMLAENLENHKYTEQTWFDNKRHFHILSPDISCLYINVCLCVYVYMGLLRDFTKVQLNVFMYLSHEV